MKDQNQPIRILIPDGHNPMAAGVLQCLSDIKGIEIYLMAELWLLPVRLSRFIHKFTYFPPTREAEEWIDRVNEQTLKYSIDVILPVFVTASRYLIEYRDKLKKPNALLLPPNLDSFDTANNKGMLADFLSKLRLPVPRYWHLDVGGSNQEELAKAGPFPLMLKPTLDSGAGKGIKRFDTPEDLRRFLTTTPLKSPHFLQECIEGYDMGCHVLCRDGKILAVVMQKGFLFSKKAYTPQVGMDMIFEESVFEQVERLMTALNWSGLADLDLRFDERSGQYKILEINPRPWLTILGSNVAGVNFPWLYCQTVLGKEFEVPAFKKTSYYTWHGIRIALINNPGMVFKGKYLWNHTPIRYMWRDPLVTLLEFVRIALRQLKSGIRVLAKKFLPKN